MNTPKTITISAIFAATALTTSWSSPAQAQTSTQPDELQAIYACSSISTADERLACYDDAVGLFKAAEKSGEVVTVSKTAIEKVERDAFGFNLPSLPSLGRIFGGKDKGPKSSTNPKNQDDLTAPAKQAEIITSSPSPSRPSPALEKPKPSKITEVTLDIRKTTSFGRNQTRFFFENGQVWEQIERIEIRIPRNKKGRKNNAEIRKAALGSFFLRVNGKGTAIRVRRVR